MKSKLEIIVRNIGQKQSIINIISIVKRRVDKILFNQQKYVFEIYKRIESEESEDKRTTVEKKRQIKRLFIHLGKKGQQFGQMISKFTSELKIDNNLDNNLDNNFDNKEDEEIIAEMWYYLKQWKITFVLNIVLLEWVLMKIINKILYSIKTNLVTIDEFDVIYKLNNSLKLNYN